MSETTTLKYWQAINDALRLEMRRDERILVLGEDVAGAAGRERDGLVDAWGGPYGITRGLIQEFGAERVRDTPISEAAFIGAAIGLAVDGYRPWVDLMFTHFAGVAWDQITNKLSRLHYQTGGQAKVPLTLKTFGTCYAPFLHFPGLICVAASDAYTVKGLTIAALRDDNPVVCFDNVHLVRQAMEVPEGSYTVPLGKARLLRHGSDITLIGLSASTSVCLDAATRLAEQGIEAEVVDLLTLMPWDIETVTDSVAKTGRLAIVDFDHPTCSLASEIIATLSERAEAPLLSPPLRLLPPNVPLSVEDGNPTLTKMYFPSADRVADAVERLLSAGSAHVS
jgi:pyruvate dehydrogenase E1 component beta subunit